MLFAHLVCILPYITAAGFAGGSALFMPLFPKNRLFLLCRESNSCKFL